MEHEQNPESAAFIEMEKKAKQRLDKAMTAWKAHSAGVAAVPETVAAELDQAKRDWEAARKSLEVFAANRSQG